MWKSCGFGVRMRGWGRLTSWRYAVWASLQLHPEDVRERWASVLVLRQGVIRMASRVVRVFAGWASREAGELWASVESEVRRDELGRV